MIVHRKLICPDGTELVSRYRHNFVTHVDKTNGKTYMLDGGIDNGYFRVSVNGDEKIVEITSSHPFEEIRNNLERYNMHSKTYVKLKDISNEWLENIITWFIEKELDKAKVFLIYLEEKLYRMENEIHVPEELC
jgi:hypothetical protein